MAGRRAGSACDLWRVVAPYGRSNGEVRYATGSAATRVGLPTTAAVGCDRKHLNRKARLGSDPDAAFDTLSAAAARPAPSRRAEVRGCPVPDQAECSGRRVLPAACRCFHTWRGEHSRGSWQTEGADAVAA